MKRVLGLLFLFLLFMDSLFAVTLDASVFNTDSSEIVLTEEGLCWEVYSGVISSEFEIEKSGKYNLVFEYISLDGRRDDIELFIMIDDVPVGDSYISLNRSYSYGDIRRDNNGNDLRGVITLKREPLSEKVRIKNGLHKDFLTVDLAEGSHKLSIKGRRTGFILTSVNLVPVDNTEVHEECDKYSGSSLIHIEAENIYSSSSTVLNSQYDRSSSSVSPSDPSRLVLNIAGGLNWNHDGQMMSWGFNVTESGYYTLGIKARQNFNKTMSVYRRCYIDGKSLPGSFGQIEFPAASDWNLVFVDDYIYLEEGFHTISLEVIPGPHADILDSLRNAVTKLNEIYSDMIMVTGVNPDANREYNLDREIPTLIPAMNEVCEMLIDASSDLNELYGKKGISYTAISTLLNQLSSFIEDPESITSRIAVYRNNITALTTWLYSFTDSPLDVDWIELKMADASFSDYRSNFFKDLRFQSSLLINSFSGTESEEDGDITVWIQAGRDQMQVIKDLVSEDFTPSTGHTVNINLVQTGIEQAILAGSGPDVVLFLGFTSPVTLAMRDALFPLDEFADFDEQILSYTDYKSLIPYEYLDNYYALPLTEVFPLLFYRTDIFENLGLDVPHTWEDVKRAIPVIQRSNMDVGIPSGFSTFLTLLMQHGGNLYRADATATELDSQNAVEAFEEYTALFSDYTLPLSYDFFNRFRSGEMPLGIVDYTEWGRLSYAAPEIEGLYDIATIPATDGNSEVASSGGQCAVILKNTENPDISWEFLKWFTSVEVQTEYANRIESLLGPSGRYQSVSDEVIRNLAWLPSEAEVILEAKNSSSLPEQIPGSYYTQRNITSAFRNVVIKKRNPREMLEHYSELIDREIARKRTEIGLEGINE